ncbi:UPF0182 family protein [Corynebacterium sp. TAE3-ERU16]|uniref:UPF0182 protein JIM95_00960 n=1 Tax=Corynebacterium antarcticum TaxID=2800405 RepID=A0ABS1FIA8_9CORY|nr:UPF0182 family protein [Corynebacterium sp. TAE3-ERU16]
MSSGLSPQKPFKRPPRLVSGIIFLVALVIFVGPILIGYYTDWLWFSEVDFRGVFTRVLVTRIVLFLVFGVIAAAIVWLAGYLAFRYRPDDMDDVFGFEPDNPIRAYRAAIEQSLKRVMLGVPIFIGILAGIVGQANWTTVSLFLNGSDFGVSDPQFHRDYGFYAFTLPLIRLVVGSLSSLLIVAFLVALVGHYLLGGIRVGANGFAEKGAMSNPARIQLAVTAGLWMLLRVVSYWLDRYDLLSAQHGGGQGSSFYGGSYTDINAVLPAKILLMVIAVVVAAAFFSAVVLRDLRIPALATGLMVLSAVVIGTAWPLAIEQFSVAPNRAEKESKYIARNIEATRYAYGVTDDEVTYISNWGAEGASEESVADDVATLSNIRLLDPQILSDTFTQQQQLKNFYGFPDKLNIDRYTVDGELRDYVVAAREIDPNALRDNQRDWINRHTVYTHGNGLVAAPANQVDEVARDVGSTRGGYPVYTVSDLQTLQRRAENEEAEKLGIEVDEPRVYFGPVIASGPTNSDYAIVGGTLDGKALEYDTDGSSYTYTGSGGVSIGNIVNRTAFALRYQEINMLLSDRIDGNSKIIFERDPRSRVEKVAPWLTTDSATYPTVIDGKIKWIVDGYTTLSNLPYAQRTTLSEVTRDSLNANGTNQRLLTDQVGYIRNSVKAVVDAYDGSVELYEFDDSDPVLKAWEGVFPGTVKPKEEISDDLREHLRYPEDLFKVQREIIAKYHVDDARVFFTSDDFWSVPSDPNASKGVEGVNQPPYYVVAADPESRDAGFQLITPFRGLERQFLAAHMSVSSDPDNFGKITVRVLPTQTQTLGPAQAQDTMMSSDQVARDRSLWEGTNDIKNGNLLTLPVGGGEILYVEPIYTQRKDQDSAFPKLLRVLVNYNGQVGYAPTIAEALSQVGIDPRSAADVEEATDLPDSVGRTPAGGDSGGGGEATEPSTTIGGVPAADLNEAMDRVSEALKGLNDAKNASHEEYGRALDRLDRAVAEYQRLQNQATSDGADSDPAVPNPADPEEANV